MKLSQEQRNEIRKLRAEGMTFNNIAAKFGISYSSARYHSSEENKRAYISFMVENFRNKPIEERRRIYKRRLPYIRAYIKKKYQTNQGFRENEIKRVVEYMKENKNDNANKKSKKNNGSR